VALHMVSELQVTIDLAGLKNVLANTPEGATPEALALAAKLVAENTTSLNLSAANALHSLGLSFNDQIYPSIVKHVLPEWSLGLFAAVLVGSILSSFNSALNSASTLFCLEFYEQRLNDADYSSPEAKSHQVVKMGKLFGTALAVASMIIAPMLAQMESIFEYLQKVNGLYSVPIISIFLMGILTKKAPAIAAKAAMAVGIGAYGYFTFFPVDGLHWLHAYFICFLGAVLSMVAFAATQPKSAEEIAQSDERAPAPVDMTPWVHAKTASIIIVVLTVGMYVGLEAIS